MKERNRYEMRLCFSKFRKIAPMKKPFNTEQRDATKATERKFSMEQVAELIGGVHPSTVCRLMNERKIGYYQIGTRRMVGESHLQEFLRLAEREAKVRSIH